MPIGLGALAVGVPLFFLMLLLNRNKTGVPAPILTQLPEVQS